MIVHTSCAKVGHRQAPHQNTQLPTVTGCFTFYCTESLSQWAGLSSCDIETGPDMATAVFGGGCFWCLDAQFRLVRGVTSVTCGYAGGRTPNPSYEAVCRGDTGHAEVVRVEYRSEEIEFRALVELFLACHDPTTQNRQGHDVGTQYRSIIICRNDEEKRVAGEVIDEWDRAGYWPAPIVTELCEAMPFYPAEPYHQDYLAHHPTQGYCVAVVAPKVAKFRDLLSSSVQTRANPA